MDVTPEQVKDCWYRGTAIFRGDDYAPVEKTDLGALGDIDMEEAPDGTWHPTEEMWEVMADQLNSETPSEVAGGSGLELMEELLDADIDRDRAEQGFGQRLDAALATDGLGDALTVESLAEAAQEVEDADTRRAGLIQAAGADRTIPRSAYAHLTDPPANDDR
ncbi:hypothetical protein [Streptomyces buecherae]|uniref:hypothetical protein n=1 Tax=Streptomyces buecherae TaxID=2763006 RepID=UPI0037A3812D